MQETKKIDILGQSNRYAVKKLINNHKEEKAVKKRVVSEKWNFESECYEYLYQLKVLKLVFANLDADKTCDDDNDIVTKIIIQEIKKKINNYKQQDIIKKHFEEDKFLRFETVIQKLAECELKCRYCDC
jgi:hypothetical protein